MTNHVSVRCPAWTVTAATALLGALIAALAVAAPFTKVEESFNLQATHDILFHGADLDKYDHHEFPGVVPRTFLGPLLLAAAVSPLKWAMQLAGWPVDDVKWVMLHAVRITLGLAVTFSHGALARALARADGSRTTALAYLAFTATQFHGPFWASRPLPNVFALVLTNLAFARYLPWLQLRSSAAPMPAAVTWCWAFAGLVFRSELVLLAGPLYAYEVFGRRRHVGRLVATALVAGTATVATTLAVDSYFWRAAWTWPELAVLKFNTLDNQSHRWGTSPWHAYATRHVPALMLGALPWTFLAAVSGRSMKKWTRACLALATLYVAAYSFLPHKEARFVFYAVPLLNAAGAAAAVRVYPRARVVVGLALAASLAASLAVSLAMAAASAHNYPGGNAMRCLQSRAPACDRLVPRNATVHVDNLTAQTGAARFLERADGGIVYSKVEGLSLAERRARFDAMFVEATELTAAERASGVCFDGLTRVNPFAAARNLMRGEWRGLIEVAPAVCLVSNKQYRV
ncbi:alpha-1,6- mannosyltransferase [Blastocladiella emersonii ATCC 22665]|nr:alpha-1,6- mannosyltransferase [Blastocladiella emersonii ATCC 22665]